MTFASNITNVANRLLKKYGEELLTFTAASGDVFNPPTGGVSGGSTSTYTAYAQTDQYTSGEADGNSILATDIKLIVQSNTRPCTGDTVEIESIVYRIMSVKPIRAQAQSIIYECQLRD